MRKLLLLFLGCTLYLYAFPNAWGEPLINNENLNALQSIVVTGKVTDSSNEPIIGVTIIVEGTNVGTISGADGSYTITVPGGQAVLKFSFVGYLDEKVSVNNQKEVSIILVEDIKQLSEIVVVGYGTQNKGSITGAIAAVQGKELVKVSNNDMTNSLTGRTPGLRVVQMSSEVGKYDTKIDIRGFSSTDPSITNNIAQTQSSGPLFVIDGIPRGQGEFSRLDANEIESISVLKDAAAAIYGLKAANGVILVTTKKGKQGKLQVQYTGQMGIQRVTQYPKLCNAYQFAVLTDENDLNNVASGNLDAITPKYSAQQIEDFRTGVVPSVDYLSLALGKSSSQQQHNLTINGGSDKIQYFASAGYFDETGLLKSGISWAKKYNFRVNVDAEIQQGLKLGVNIGFVNDITNAPSAPLWRLLRDTWSMSPAEPIYANNNPLYLNYYPLNANKPVHPLVAFSDKTGYDHNDENYLSTVFKLNYAVPYVPGLNASFQYSYNMNYNLEKVFKKKVSQYTYDTSTQLYNETVMNGPSQVSESFGQGYNKNMQLALRYQKLFGKHNISAQVVFEQSNFVNNGHYLSRELIVDAIDQLQAGSAATSVTNSSYTDGSIRSYVGKVNYDFAGKYLLEGGFRHDGSSQFPSNSRWATFPYFSAGWRISEESFMKNKLRFVDNLKIRGSWGKLGDDSPSAPGLFPWISGYTYPTGYYVFGTTTSNALGFANSVNPNITWYTSTTTDFGMEGSLWHSLFTFEIDYFRRNREGLLGNRVGTLPATYGVNPPQENLNGDRTQGYEIVLGHKNKIREVSYSVSANVSYARTMNTDVNENSGSSTKNSYRNLNKNRYNDLLWGYKTDGQFKNYDEIYAAPIMDGQGNRTILPGDLKYKDINGDGVIDGNDETVIGHNGTKPLMYFGSNIQINWKGIDFSMLLQGATMYQVYYNDQLSAPFFNGANPITEFWDRWHHTDVLDSNSPWVAGKYPSTGARQNYKINDFWLRDGSYLRIKSIEIGFTLPQSLTSKLHIDKLRVFGNAYNIHTWTKGLDFIDPESSANRLYGYSYPVTLNMNCGLQLNF